MDIGWTWGSTEAITGLAVLVDAAVKGTVLLGLAWGVTLVLRRKSAAVRHWVWMMAVGGLAALPVLGVMLPGWGVLPRFSILDLRSSMVAEDTPRPPAESRPPRADVRRISPPTDSGGTTPPPIRTAPAPVPMDDGSVGKAVPTPTKENPALMTPAPTAVASEVPEVETAARVTLDGATVLLALWAAGVIALLLPIVVGMLWLRRMRSSGIEVTDGQWRAMLERLAAMAGVKRKVGLWLSARCVVPLTYGVWRPVIVLPAEAVTWPEERRQMELLHELAHIRRWDCLTQMLVRCVRAAYWFHPLAWLAAARAQAECERACDDRVLTAGTKGSTYAAALMEYAAPLAGERASAGRRCYVPTGALAMARVSTLETRVLGILDGTVNRCALSRLGMALVVLLAACTVVPLAVMKGASKPFVEVTVVWHADAAAHFAIGEATRMPRRLTLTDAADVQRLTAYFPQLGEGRKAYMAGGWMSFAEFTFRRADGTEVHINTDPDLTAWSEGYGDWQVKGDLGKELAGLPWAESSGEIAWGKAVDGIEMGIRLPQAKYVFGDTFAPELWARNVTDKPLDWHYRNTPEWRDSTTFAQPGKPGEIAIKWSGDGIVSRVYTHTTHLEPGKEAKVRDLETLKVEPPPAGSKDPLNALVATPGIYTVWADWNDVNDSFDAKSPRWRTGNIQVEIAPSTALAPATMATATHPAASLAIEMAATQPSGAPVILRVRITNTSVGDLHGEFQQDVGFDAYLTGPNNKVRHVAVTNGSQIEGSFIPSVTLKPGASFLTPLRLTNYTAQWRDYLPSEDVFLAPGKYQLRLVRILDSARPPADPESIENTRTFVVADDPALAKARWDELRNPAKGEEAFAKHVLATTLTPEIRKRWYAEALNADPADGNSEVGMLCYVEDPPADIVPAMLEIFRNELNRLDPTSRAQSGFINNAAYFLANHLPPNAGDAFLKCALSQNSPLADQWTKDALNGARTASFEALRHYWQDSMADKIVPALSSKEKWIPIYAARLLAWAGDERGAEVLIAGAKDKNSYAAGGLAYLANNRAAAAALKEALASTDATFLNDLHQVLASQPPARASSAPAPALVTQPATTRVDPGVDATRAATQPGAADPSGLLSLPRITLSVEKGSLDDVTAALTKATGIVFSVQPVFGAQPVPPASTFTVHAKDEPLWEVIRDLNTQQSFQYLASTSGVRLVPQAGGPVPQVAGPLIIYARPMTTGEAHRDTVGLYYRLTAFADPRLYLVAGQMDFTEATDSQGNKLVVLEYSPAAGGSRGSVGPRDEARVNQLLWELGVTLPTDSKAKVNVKGTARLLLVDKFATRTLEEPEKHLGEAMELGGRKVTITQFGTTPVGRAPGTPRLQCQMNVDPAPEAGALPAPPDMRAETGSAAAWFVRYTVLDATGRALTNETAPTPSNRLMATGQGPYRIVISAPLTWKAVTVPIELRGLEVAAAAASSR